MKKEQVVITLDISALEQEQVVITLDISALEQTKKKDNFICNDILQKSFVSKIHAL